MSEVLHLEFWQQHKRRSQHVQIAHNIPFVFVQTQTKFGALCAVAATVWYVFSVLSKHAFSKNMFIACAQAALRMPDTPVCTDLFFCCEVALYWDTRTQAHWSTAPYLSFKFIGLLRSPALLRRATIPLSLTSFICSRSMLAKPKVCILAFPTPGIRILCVPTFPFLHLISCTRESSLSSSCAACTADWCVRLGAL